MLRHKVYKIDYHYIPKIHPIILSMALWAIASTVAAQVAETQTQPLSLDLRSAVQLALQKSPLLSGAQATVKQSESEYLSSFSGYLPNVSGDVSQSRQVINLQTTGITSIPAAGFPNLSSIKKVGPFNVFDSRVSVDQTILDLEAIYNIRASKQGVTASEHSFDNTQQLVETNTVSAYIDVLRSDAEVKRTQADLNTAQTLYNLAKDLLKVGIDTGLDVTRAQVQLQNAEQALLEAKNNLEVTRMFLARTIGIPPSTPLTLKEGLQFEEVVKKPPKEAMDLAFKIRPDLLALKSRENEFALRVKGAKAEWLPKLGFHADYGANGLTPDEAVIPTWSVAGTLRIPIFNSGRTIADIQRAKAQLDQIQSQIADLSNQIEFDVGSALLNLNSASEQVEVAREGVSLAQKSLKLSQDRFNQGLTNNVEVVNAQNDLARSEENLIRALYNYNLARVSLAKAIGDITLVYNLK
jgi:TolC family type I secretion outer membrane protein